MRRDGSVQQVIEPIVQAVFSPSGSNPDEIPNEDSLDFEFDDTNLFKLNRFAGRDRVDSGTRIDYGLEWTGLLASGGSAGASIRHSYRFPQNPHSFHEASGLSAKPSNPVRRVHTCPHDVTSRLFLLPLSTDTPHPPPTPPP